MAKQKQKELKHFDCNTCNESFIINGVIVCKMRFNAVVSSLCMCECVLSCDWYKKKKG